MTPIELIDGYMAELATIGSEMASRVQVMNSELEKVTSKHAAFIDARKKRIEQLERQLEHVVKKHRDVILVGKDRRDLPSGSVMLKIEKRVKRIRKMLANLKAAGMMEAVKVDEAVDWDKVDGFDDATLAKLGTKRVPKDLFSYELKGGVSSKGTKK